MEKEIVVVCQCPDECEIYTDIASTIIKDNDKNIRTIANPSPDKSRYDSVIFVFEGQPCNDRPMLNSWVGHQHIACVSGNTPEEKKENFAKIFRHVCGIPMPVEIERKYLIKYPPIQLLENMPNCARADITQVYLDIPGVNARLRKRTVDGVCTYIRTEKYMISEIKQGETEWEITEEEYNRLLDYKHHDMAPIVKRRYCLLYNGQYLEIDVFPFWSDKAYAECELISEDVDVEMPPFLEIIREVTSDKRYTNKSLAQLVHNNKICELG